MRPVPLVAGWQVEPLVDGAFAARLSLGDLAWFAGHYPGAPILPGSLLIEALFQAVTMIWERPLRIEEIVSCRFQSPLRPGDSLLARFALEAQGDGRLLVEVAAAGSAPAAQLTLLVGSAEPVPARGVEAPPSVVVSRARTLDASFILRALPHRPPALLLDEAAVFERRRPALLARKVIVATEPCYAGADASSRGPYPAMLVLESFCQACGLLRAATAPAGEERDQGKAPVVAKLAGLRFLGDAFADDVLEHHVELVVRTDDGAVFAGRTTVAGRAVIDVKRVVAALAPIPGQR